MREALVASAIRSAQFAEALGLPGDRIILACKVSNVQDLIAVYTELARRCDYPLHLGLTEAGMGSKGIVASTAALAVLLQQGIGDTIRISLTPEPNGDRTREVIVAQEILQTMGLRSFAPLVSACPGCGRTTSEYFQELADKIQTYLRAQMPAWRKRYHGVENMTVAVMGCVVNGPGESKMANIGISLPGTGEVPVAPVYVDGQKTVTLKGDRSPRNSSRSSSTTCARPTAANRPRRICGPRRSGSASSMCSRAVAARCAARVIEHASMSTPPPSLTLRDALLRVDPRCGQRQSLSRRLAEAILDAGRQAGARAQPRAPGRRHPAATNLCCGRPRRSLVRRNDREKAGGDGPALRRHDARGNRTQSAVRVHRRQR